MKNKDLSRAHRWVTALRTQDRAEYDRIRTCRTPSDWLVECDRQGTRYGGVRFPLSLSTGSGQRLLYDVVCRVEQRLALIPLLAWRTTLTLPALAQQRRTSAARRNAVAVGEAVLHRSATEMSSTVLCAWWTIQEWIIHVYDVRLSPSTVEGSLRFWTDLEGSPLRVLEWGERGGAQRPTKIVLHYDSVRSSRFRTSHLVTTPREDIGSSGSLIDSDDWTEAAKWVDEHAHAMESIHLLQEAGRQANAARKAERSRAAKEQHAEEARRIEARVSAHIDAGMPGFGSVEGIERTSTETEHQMSEKKWHACPLGHTGDDVMELLTPTGGYWPVCLRCLSEPVGNDGARWTPEDSEEPERAA